jgi:hypothetical protein
MRLTFLAAALVAAMTSPVQSKTRPVEGAVQGTTMTATGVARGAGEAGVGIVRGTRTAGQPEEASLHRDARQPLLGMPRFAKADVAWKISASND